MSDNYVRDIVFSNHHRPVQNIVDAHIYIGFVYLTGRFTPLIVKSFNRLKADGGDGN